MAKKTLKQLEEIIKELKCEIRDLKANQINNDLNDLPYKDVVVYKKDKDFIKAEIEFDPVNKLAKYGNEQKLGRDIDVATFKLIEELSLRMIKL
jgi:hypothetical protein